MLCCNKCIIFQINAICSSRHKNSIKIIIFTAITMQYFRLEAKWNIHIRTICLSTRSPPISPINGHARLRTYIRNSFPKIKCIALIKARPSYWNMSTWCNPCCVSWRVLRSSLWCLQNFISYNLLPISLNSKQV